MNAVIILFYAFGLVAGLSALAILLTRNVFHAALYLLACLLAVAALYVMSYAELLAVAQIVIYAGGVLVVILFAIMLTTRISGKALVVTNTNMFSGALAAGIILCFLVYFIPGSFTMTSPSSGLQEGNITSVGINLLTYYALPFEMSGLILLVALVGAAIATSQTRPRQS